MRRRPLLILALTAAVFAAFPILAAPVPEYEQEFASRINTERSSAGLGSLAFDGHVLEVARRHSVRMSEAGNIFHNDNLPNEVEGWVKLGENVGRGKNVEDIHRAFMLSDAHRAQILGSDYEFVAVGVEASSDGTLWVTEIFVKRAPSETQQSSSSSRTTSSGRLRVASSSTTKAQEPPSPPDTAVAAAQFPEQTLQAATLVDMERSPQQIVTIPDVTMRLEGATRSAVLAAVALGSILIAVSGHVIRKATAPQQVS